MTAVPTYHPSDEADLHHDVVHRDGAAYSAHPHLTVAADGTWLLVFTQAPRRRVILHPPLDPAFRNMLMRSKDEGRTWIAPEPVPAGDWTGVECAGLTTLPDGAVLLNQWQFGWVDPDTAGETTRSPEHVRPDELDRMRRASTEFAGLADAEPAPDLFPRARQGGTTWVHRAASAAGPFGSSARIDTAPYSGGYGLRGGLVLLGGDVLLPLCDVPYYSTVFTVRSGDGGATWGAPTVVAADPACEFEEPAPALLADGRIVMLLRENRSRTLHAVWSDDEGATWSPPRPTSIADYPADLLVFGDGRLAMVAGRRRPPYGIALRLSGDGGESWSAPIAVRDDLANIDLGYPTLAPRRNGDLVVVYYAQDDAGVTCIQSTVVSAEVLTSRRKTP